MRRRPMLLVLLLAGLGACAPRGNEPRLVVFFNADSAGLDDAARSVIQQAAEQARRDTSKQVRVLGFAAPDSGSAAFNRVLAEARAQNVADGLVTAGVAKGRVQLQSRGAVPFDMMPMESRRVEIVVDR